MKSGLGKVLSYVGSFFIGAGIFIGFILISIFWLSALVMLSGVSLGLIMLGLSKVIAQQEEILAAVAGKAGTSGLAVERENGTPHVEG